MITSLKLLVASLLIGVSNPYWGLTYIAEGNGKIYALRSLDKSSSLCVFEQPKRQNDSKCAPILLTSLGEPLVEATTQGRHSCHITILAHQAVVADYTSGTLSLFDLTKEGVPLSNPQILKFKGSGPHPKRQLSPHIHSSALSPDGKSIVVVDLGCDCLYCFDVHDGRIVAADYTRVALPVGCGPRFSTFSPNGDFLYVVTELSDEVLVLDTATFSLKQRISLGKANPEGGSHIAMSHDGRYLYASLRVAGTGTVKTNSIADGVAVYKRLEDGVLEYLYYLPTGGHPRHFAISKDDRYLVVACRDSDVVEIFPINSRTGIPQKCKKRIEVKKPVFCSDMIIN